MKVLILNGSPRPKGNTKQMLDAFCEGLEKGGHEYDLIDVCRKNIHGCLACEYCHTKGNGECIQKDDMQEIYPLLHSADILVLASPIYYHNMSGQLKCCIDRFYASGSSKELSNLKGVVMFLSSGDPDMYDGALFSLRGDFEDYLGLEVKGVFTTSGYEPGVPEEKLDEIRKFGETLQKEKVDMKKPYIVCHMMTSLDGRIDCAMTARLKGVDDYYTTLNALDVQTTVSGRVTAELELALQGKFEDKNGEPCGKAGFSKKADAEGYEVVVDTKGTLLWPDAKDMDKPYLIVMSEKVSTEYLNYLDGQNISWIVCGKEHIDLAEASRVLAEEFGVERMAIVGGPTINTAFLDAGLLDEVSILIGLGIDGRSGMPAVFDGLDAERNPIALTLKESTVFESGAVWLRYCTK